MIVNTAIGSVRLEKRRNYESDYEFYDVYKVANHPYKQNDEYLGELHTHNEGKALELDVFIFLQEERVLEVC